MFINHHSSNHRATHLARARRGTGHTLTMGLANCDKMSPLIRCRSILLSFIGSHLLLLALKFLSCIYTTTYPCTHELTTIHMHACTDRPIHESIPLTPLRLPRTSLSGSFNLFANKPTYNTHNTHTLSFSFEYPHTPVLLLFQAQGNQRDQMSPMEAHHNLPDIPLPPLASPHPELLVGRSQNFEVRLIVVPFPETGLVHPLLAYPKVRDLIAPP